jgi:hypothetical protein
LSALIGTRCYPREMKEETTLPCVVYHLVSTPPNTYADHDAATNRWRYRVQLDLYDDTYDGCKSLYAQAFAAWQGYNDGDVGWAWVVNVIDDYETQPNLYKRIIELVIDHTI